MNGLPFVLTPPPLAWNSGETATQPAKQAVLPQVCMSASLTHTLLLTLPDDVDWKLVITTRPAARVMMLIAASTFSTLRLSFIVRSNFHDRDGHDWEVPRLVDAKKKPPRKGGLCVLLRLVKLALLNALKHGNHVFMINVYETLAIQLMVAHAASIVGVHHLLCQFVRNA